MMKRILTAITLISLSLSLSLSLKAQMPPMASESLANPPSVLPIRNTNITTGTATSLVVPLPAGSLAGDLCVFVFQGQNNGLNTPTGWTQTQYSGTVSYWGGSFYYKVLASGDITAGSITLTTGGTPSPMIVVGIDFLPSITSYVTGQFIQNGSTPSSTATTPILSGTAVGNVVIWVSGARTNGPCSVSRGRLVQSAIVGTAGSAGVYVEQLQSGFSTAVTYSMGGTFNPQGYYDGWIAVN